MFLGQRFPQNILHLRNRKDIPVLNLGGDCDWSGDSGVRIAAKNNQLLFVGKWCDINLWSKGPRDIFDSMFNFANQD